MTVPHRPLPLLDGLAAIADRYDVLFCDVWGVVHNGVAAFPEALEALIAFRGRGGAVVLVSNAPRPHPIIVRQLEQLGVARTAYDFVVTSGDVTREVLGTRPGAAVYHIGPERDIPTLDGLDIVLVGPDEAEVIVCTGLFDDRREEPENYRARLMPLQDRGLPLICANPDFVVDVGGRLFYCAGAIADLYAEMGGSALYAGKPYEMIYQTAHRSAEAALGRPVPKARILAIGDALRTDLEGAARYGTDALFIASGIHAAELAGAAGLDPVKLARLLARDGARPIAAQWRLVW
jgi:HAD superfamily hydrolase (TIGR01459 family)